MGYRAALRRALAVAPATVVSGALLAAPLTAGAATAGAGGRPVRTLTFDVDVHVAAVRATPGEGISGTRPAVVVKGRMRSQSSGGTATGERTTGAAIGAKGSIGVDVLAATDDAGLVIEIAETATERTRPKVRLAVDPDGGILFDPKNAENLTEEELAVVHWLARGFYGDHPTAPGTMWTVDQSANGNSDIEHYRVVARDAHRVTLDYSQERKVSGTGGFAGTRGGTLVYDTAMAVPVSATFQSESRRQIGAAQETLRTSVSLTLTADSFPKR